MHSWGDEDFTYWAEVELAAEYIDKFCRRWGRIQVSQSKEKWGTVRVYCSLYCDSLHTLIFPGYGWIRTLFPNPHSFYVEKKTDDRAKWQIYLNSLSYRFWTVPVLRPFKFIIEPYQRFIYRLAYKNAIKKWPMIREEILCCADWPEYLEDL